MDFIEDALNKYKLKKRDLMESLLISEEILVQLSETAVENSNVQVSVTSWLGVPRVKFVSEGDVIDLGEPSIGVSLNELDNNETSIRNMMLHSFSDSIRYQHTKSKNYVTVITGIPERELANQTIIALILSVVFGSIFRIFCPNEFNHSLIENFLGPIETLFISSLTFIASPAVFISITCAILRFDGFTELNRSGKRIIFTYVITSCIAIFIGVLVFYLIQPGTVGILPSQMGESSIGNLTILEMITDAIPSNIIEPFLSGNSLQLIVAALIIGLALNLSTKKVSTLKGVLSELDIVCGNVATIIMKTVPFVVFCSTTRVFLLASMDVYIAIGHLILTLIVGLLLMLLFYCVFLIIRIRINPILFLRKFLPIMKDIFLKGSSLAAIPLTLRFCKRQLGIPQNVSSFVIPLGATINMDGTCVCLSIVSLFFARICGVTLTGSDIAILLFMVFVLSLGAPIAPGTIILCMATIFSQMGISLEGISFLIGLNFILEMLLGMINSMGDVVIALDVARREGTLNYELCNKPIKKTKRK
jgi:Na+/H+-dicarboxylate symporter